eukprot:Colp12_sorted_trinity150504_noHs@24611
MVKFGKALQASYTDKWRFYYIDYDRLKAFLKARCARMAKVEDGRQYTAEDETLFVQMLEEEFSKVSDFSGVKRREIYDKITHLEDKAKQLFSKKVEFNQVTLKQLTKDIEGSTADIAKLAKFNSVNYTGFIKILKKTRQVYQLHAQGNIPQPAQHTAFLQGEL